MAIDARRKQSLFIAAFLVCQLLIPLRYYLGDSGDDERFAWRMFSTRRLHRCRVQVIDMQLRDGTVVPERVDLRKDLHVGWIAMLRRNRTQVVHRYLARRCQHDALRRAVFERSCVRSDGAALPAQRVTMDCATGKVQRAQEVP